MNYTSASSGYHYKSHCWSCHGEIDSEINVQCPVCRWYICNECFSCAEGCQGHNNETAVYSAILEERYKLKPTPSNIEGYSNLRNLNLSDSDIHKIAQDSNNGNSLPDISEAERYIAETLIFDDQINQVRKINEKLKYVVSIDLLEHTFIQEPGRFELEEIAKIEYYIQEASGLIESVNAVPLLKKVAELAINEKFEHYKIPNLKRINAMSNEEREKLQADLKRIAQIQNIIRDLNTQLAMIKKENNSLSYQIIKADYFLINPDNLTRYIVQRSKIIELYNKYKDYVNAINKKLEPFIENSVNFNYRCKPAAYYLEKGGKALQDYNEHTNMLMKVENQIRAINRIIYNRYPKQRKLLLQAHEFIINGQIDQDLINQYVDKHKKYAWTHDN